jgi:hypothetical protein
MIQKLAEFNSYEEVVEKVNEIIDEINKMDKHYHETPDTHYNTSWPKYEEDMERG